MVVAAEILITRDVSVARKLNGKVVPSDIGTSPIRVAGLSAADDPLDPVDQRDGLHRPSSTANSARSSPVWITNSPAFGRRSAAIRASRSRWGSVRLSKIGIPAISSAVSMRARLHGPKPTGTRL